MCACVYVYVVLSDRELRIRRLGLASLRGAARYSRRGLDGIRRIREQKLKRKGRGRKSRRKNIIVAFDCFLYFGFCYFSILPSFQSLFIFSSFFNFCLLFILFHVRDWLSIKRAAWVTAWQYRVITDISDNAHRIVCTRVYVYCPYALQSWLSFLVCTLHTTLRSFGYVMVASVPGGALSAFIIFTLLQYLNILPERFFFQAYSTPRTPLLACRS